MKIRGWGMEYDVVPVVDKYVLGETLAVSLVCRNDEFGMREPYGNLTVKLDNVFEDDECAFVDTNNMPDAERFIEENELGAPTGIWANSGYCVYPLYHFDVERLNELAKGVE